MWVFLKRIYLQKDDLTTEHIVALLHSICLCFQQQFQLVQLKEIKHQTNVTDLGMTIYQNLIYLFRKWYFMGPVNYWFIMKYHKPFYFYMIIYPKNTFCILKHFKIWIRNDWEGYMDISVSIYLCMYLYLYL